MGVTWGNPSHHPFIDALSIINHAFWGTIIYIYIESTARPEEIEKSCVIILDILDVV